MNLMLWKEVVPFFISVRELVASDSMPGLILVTRARASTAISRSLRSALIS